MNSHNDSVNRHLDLVVITYNNKTARTEARTEHLSIEIKVLFNHSNTIKASGPVLETLPILSASQACRM